MKNMLFNVGKAVLGITMILFAIFSLKESALMIYCLIAVASFLAGILVYRNRWQVSILGIICLIVILALTGSLQNSAVDTDNVFVLLLGGIGIVAEPAVILARNLFNKKKEQTH